MQSTGQTVGQNMVCKGERGWTGFHPHSTRPADPLPSRDVGHDDVDLRPEGKEGDRRWEARKATSSILLRPNG